MKKKAQIGIEYLIIVGFVTLAIIMVLALAVIYSDKIKDQIKLNQVEAFGTQVINTAETVFFAGEPSKTTIKFYLPDGVEEIEIISDAVVITTHTSSGQNKRAYHSNVPLQGNITSGEGTKIIKFQAETDYVSITQN